MLELDPPAIQPMSVNHSLLPIRDSDLARLLANPAGTYDFVRGRAAEACRLFEDGLAIISLTAEGEDDPLAFMQSGAPDDVSGRIGEHAQEAHFAYGPASYYRNPFVAEVAKRLEPLTVPTFAEHCDVDVLDEHAIYPGGWRTPGRKEALIHSFSIYRECVTSTAKSGKHLLVWND
jgi:hypothetical protein